MHVYARGKVITEEHLIITLGKCYHFSIKYMLMVLVRSGRLSKGASNQYHSKTIKISLSYEGFQ